MGTWGYTPLSSDSACDKLSLAVSSLAKVIRKVAHRKSKPRFNYDGQAARGALYALTALHRAGVYVEIEVFEDGERFLKAMLADESWIKGWRDPRQIREALRKELRRTQRVVVQKKQQKKKWEERVLKRRLVKGGARRRRRRKKS